MSGQPSMPSQTTDLLNDGPVADHGLLAGIDDEGATSAAPASPLRMAMRRFRRHRLALAGLVVLVLLVLVAVFAPLIAPYDPNLVDLSSFQQPPSAEHWLGTDSAGRDVLSRLIYGTQVSLTVGIAAAISAGVLGLALGLAAGILGGKVDTVIMRIVEVFLSFRSLIVIILLVSSLGPASRRACSSSPSSSGRRRAASCDRWRSPCARWTSSSPPGRSAAASCGS